MAAGFTLSKENLKIFSECNVTHGKISNLVNDYHSIKD